MTPRPSLMAAAVVLAGSLAAAQTLGQPERFTATAVSSSPQYGTGAQTVQINVNRWSTPPQRDQLVAALMNKGPTDWPIGFWEATNRPRSFDYPFTVIQMHMDRDGTGKGTMSYATRITAKNNRIELEDFATQPVMLNNIKAEPKNATK